MTKEEGMIAEYQVLRDEINTDKTNRVNILGFTVAGIGAAMAFVLGLESSALVTYNNFSFGLITYSLIMVLIALILTTNLTKSIARIGKYIGKNIEPNIQGLGWENKWRHEGVVPRTPKFFKYAAKGQSRAYAAYYLILATAIFAVTFMVELYRTPVYMSIVSGLYLACLIYGFNLWLRVFGFKSVR